MDDITIDCDIDDDPIKRFLLHKLEEIKFKNAELQQQISKRKELINECFSIVNNPLEENALQIVSHWQRTLNGRWIVGFQVKNISNRKINNIRLVLKWNLYTPLLFKSRLFTRNYEKPQEQSSNLPERLQAVIQNLQSSQVQNQELAENELICTDEIKGCGVIVVAPNIPDIVEKPFCNITGILEYQHDGTTHQVKIPDSQILITDVIRNNVSEIDICLGQEEALLSFLTLSEETQLFIYVPKSLYITLESVFQCDPMFKAVSLISTKRKCFFCTGTLIFIEKESEVIFKLNVFSFGLYNPQLVIHFLYQNISNTVVLPKEYKHVFLNILEESEPFEEHDDETEILSKLGKALEKEINLVEQICTRTIESMPTDVVESTDKINLDLDKKTYKKFRADLADLERESDLLYLAARRLGTKREFSILQNSVI